MDKKIYKVYCIFSSHSSEVTTDTIEHCLVNIIILFFSFKLLESHRLLSLSKFSETLSRLDDKFYVISGMRNA